MYPDFLNLIAVMFYKDNLSNIIMFVFVFEYLSLTIKS